jgi:uncharacterized protein with NRDE domain
LPNTGLGIERERVISCQKIITPDYGTRCSTGLVISKNHIQFEEISWQENGNKAAKKRYHIPLST